MRMCFEKDVQKQEAMWERQHEVAAEKIYNMCSELGGFFLKVLANFLACNFLFGILVRESSKTIYLMEKKLGYIYIHIGSSHFLTSIFSAYSHLWLNS